MDNAAINYSNSIEDKSAWGALGFDIAYKTVALIVNDSNIDILQCTEMSPYCPGASPIADVSGSRQLIEKGMKVEDGIQYGFVQLDG